MVFGRAGECGEPAASHVEQGTGPGDESATSQTPPARGPNAVVAINKLKNATLSAVSYNYFFIMRQPCFQVARTVPGRAGAVGGNAAGPVDQGTDREKGSVAMKTAPAREARARVVVNRLKDATLNAVSRKDTKGR